MFDKIYRHQKVRATEAMVFSLIRELNKITQITLQCSPFKITDDELLSLTLEDIESLSGRQSKSLSEEQLSAAEKTAFFTSRNDCVTDDCSCAVSLSPPSCLKTLIAMNPSTKKD